MPTKIKDKTSELNNFLAFDIFHLEINFIYNDFNIAEKKTKYFDEIYIRIYINIYI